MTLNPFDPRFRAFRSDIHAVGIDLRRSVISTDGGAYVADPTATFRAGQVLAQNASGNFVVCDGLGAAPINAPFGFAKWNKATSLLAAAVDEAVVVNGLVASNLKHANIFGSPAGGVRVSSTPTGVTGTTYVEGAGNDYTINYTNGQITRLATTTIPDGGTVYVTYKYYPSEADLDFQGRNFWNFLDEVTVAQGRIAIITNWSVLFTSMYDPAQTYAVAQALYVDTAAKAGLLTNQAGGRPAFGRVFQLPGADDPFMGVVTPGHA
jgi:hypothetical protein